MKAASEIINSKMFIDYYEQYMAGYGNSISSGDFNKKSSLSENNIVFKLIEMLGNNILYTADAKEFNMANDSKSYTKQKMDIKLDRENKFDNYDFVDDDKKPMCTDDKMDFLFNTNMQNPKNSYLPKTQIINKVDYSDTDFDNVTSIYSASSEVVKASYISNMLSEYESLREHIKGLIKNNLSNPRKVKKLTLQRKYLIADQIELKNIIKRPIYFKNGG